MTALPYSDNFNRANASALGNGWSVRSEGAGSVYAVPDPVIGIVSNAAKGITTHTIDSIGFSGFAYHDFGTAHVDITLTVGVTDENPIAGILFRARPDGLAHWWLSREGLHYLELDYDTNILDSTNEYRTEWWANGSTVRLRTEGNSIKAWVDGVLVHDLTDARNNTETQHGLTFNQVFNPAFTADAFDIVEVPTAAPETIPGRLESAHVMQARTTVSLLPGTSPNETDI